MKSLLNALLLSLALLLTMPVQAGTRQDELDKKLVQDFLKDIRKAAFVDRDAADIRKVVEKYLSPDYVQHSERMPPGREGYIQGMTSVAIKPPANIPAGEPDNRYWISDAGLVVWVTVVPPSPTEKDPAKRKETYRFNMIRVANGKLVEHWDHAAP